MGDAEESGRNGEMFIRLTLIRNEISNIVESKCKQRESVFRLKKLAYLKININKINTLNK